MDTLRGIQLLERVGTAQLQSAAEKLVLSLRADLVRAMDGGDQNAATRLQELFAQRLSEMVSMINRDQFFGITDEDALVAVSGFDHAGWTNDNQKVYELERVVTMPGYERRGFSKQIMAVVHEALYEDPVRSDSPTVLYTEQNAIKKNAVRMGYAPISTHEYLARTALVPRDPQFPQWAEEDTENQKRAASGELPPDTTYWQAFMFAPRPVKKNSVSASDD